MTTKPNRGPLLTYRCTRCHKSKTKCSGERPSCRSCAARNVRCVYLDKDRKITISVRQLEALQNRLRFFEDSQSSRPEQSDSTPFFEPLLSSSTQEFLARVASVIDPDLEVKFNTGELDTPNIDDDDDATLPAGVAVVDNLKKFLGFLQYDYHFFLYDELLLNIDSIYSNGIDRNHPMVISQFCLVMAVGSVYDKNAIVTDEYPGYQYFRLALKYLHEVNSSFSLIAIQTHILFAWYLLILNQKGPASIHCACAVRKALHIGLHKPPESNVSPVVKEHRLRTWWTAFVVETFCVSLLGTPQHISVDHVDVPLPSNTQLGTDEEGLFFDHTYFTLYIKLALITSKILSTIYSKSFNITKDMLQILCFLDSLEQFEKELPAALRSSLETFIIKERKDLSFLLFYNQTIILALRPVFWYYFNLASIGSPKFNGTIWSLQPIVTGLAAAKSLIKILKFCKENQLISKLGFYDPNHLYSAILIVLISNIMKDRKGFYEISEPMSIIQFQAESGNKAARSIWNDLNSFFQTASIK